MNSPKFLAWRSDPHSDDAAIETHLRASIDSGDRSLTSIAALSTRPQGASAAVNPPRERARATVAAIMLAGAADPDAPLAPDVIDIAVAVELVDVGTNYHDDVIAQVTVRNGEPTANHIHGDLQAILAGDFLIARASELAAAHGTEIAAELATTIGWMCEGRHRELAERTGTTVDHRLTTLELRSARLFRSAMRIGALFAGADLSTADAYGDVGRRLGLAEAIERDISRFLDGDAATDRLPTDDLAAGRWTLPAIAFAETSPPDDDWAAWHRAAAESDAVAFAQTTAANHTARAIELLRPLADRALVDRFADSLAQ